MAKIKEYPIEKPSEHFVSVAWNRSVRWKLHEVWDWVSYENHFIYQTVVLRESDTKPIDRFWGLSFYGFKVFRVIDFGDTAIVHMVRVKTHSTRTNIETVKGDINYQVVSTEPFDQPIGWKPKRVLPLYFDYYTKGQADRSNAGCKLQYQWEEGYEKPDIDPVIKARVDYEISRGRGNNETHPRCKHRLLKGQCGVCLGHKSFHIDDEYDGHEEKATPMYERFAQNKTIKDFGLKEIEIELDDWE